MPRHYTDDEKQLVLERLVANNGNVTRTAKETGISRRAIYTWRENAQSAQSTVSHLLHLPPVVQNGFDSPRPEGEGLGVRAEIAVSLRDLQTQMLTDAHVLAQSIQSAIADAPLGQRVAALAQLIDRIIKLAAQLPGEPSEPNELIVTFVGHVEKEEDHEDPDDDSSTEAASQPAENYE
jgi:hypothetical protein